jgi:outer membrane biosynthesis protein TonB
VNTSIRPVAALVAMSALSALAACGRQATMTDDLKHDLDQASTASVELAPRGQQTAVVSAIELGESAAPQAKATHVTPARRAPERTKAPATTHVKPVVQQVAVTPTKPEPQPVAEQPAPVQEAPAPTPAPAAPPVIDAPAPSPMPSPSTEPGRSRHGRTGRGGGWWSTGDVIRNAPFPINP